LHNSLVLELLEDGLRQAHVLEILDGRRDVITLDEDVPLAADGVSVFTGHVTDGGRGFPSGGEGLRVGDVLGELADGHEGFMIGEVLDHLDLLLHELLGGGDLREIALELGSLDEEAGLGFVRLSESAAGLEGSRRREEEDPRPLRWRSF
jgi:hypothetical protein